MGGVGQGAFLLWTLPLHKTQNLPCSQKDYERKARREDPHYCSPVLLEFMPAIQTGPHPLWGLHLWVSEATSSCSLSLFPSWVGVSCQITPDGHAREVPSARNLPAHVSCCCSRFPYAALRGGGSPQPMCHDALGHSVPKAGAQWGKHPSVGPWLWGGGAGLKWGGA